VGVHGPPRLYFEPIKLLSYNFNADPDPAFHSHVDPDPVSPIMRIHEAPDPQSCIGGFMIFKENMIFASTICTVFFSAIVLSKKTELIIRPDPDTVFGKRPGSGIRCLKSGFLTLIYCCCKLAGVFV
jgi:hypothetical protein